MSLDRGRLVVDVAVELKTGFVELAAQLRSPNPHVGNPDLGVPRCAADPTILDGWSATHTLGLFQDCP